MAHPSSTVAQRRHTEAKMRRRSVALFGTPRFAANLTPCSCAMCGNPRRHFGDPTVQEKRIEESEHYQLRELGLE